MEEAEALLGDMQRRRISANVITYNMLLRGYAERGDLKVDTHLKPRRAVLSQYLASQCAEGTHNRQPCSISQ